MSAKRKRSPEPGEGESIFRSGPIEDRSSTFIGLFSPSLKPKELQKLEEINSASHKMLAWRRESNQQSITGATKFTTDHDDDGEKYGGKRIEKVLDSMQVIGACVVARWYGGVMLGPVRFEHIENCAREAVQKWKDALTVDQAKKRKAEEDAAQKRRLIKVLAERDQSVVVLRELASEKEEKLRKAKAGGDDAAELDPLAARENRDGMGMQSVIAARGDFDYTSLPLDRLKALEKGRDATLSFLLKRIDDAEVELVGVTGRLPPS